MDNDKNICPKCGRHKIINFVDFQRKCICEESGLRKEILEYLSRKGDEAKDE